MGQMIKLGKEFIRINPEKKDRIEYSINEGKNWYKRFEDSNCGDFLDLVDNGKDLLAQTSKGLYYSLNNGKNWYKR